MTNLGFEHLIEMNPSKENWYELCDHLATKPITMINEGKNVNIIARTIKNEFYHKYVDNIWRVNKNLPEVQLVGEASCVSIDANGEIVCFSRTDNPTQFVIWSRKDNSFQLINNNIELLSDFSCLSAGKISCFVVNQDENIYGMLCEDNLICSKWLLINSKIKSFRKTKPISFVYPSLDNKNENLAIYALTNDGLPYVTTCQQCVNNWNNQWSQWMELTSKPLLTIESTFIDFQQQKIFLIALTDDFQFAYSIFDYQNHIPSPFYKLNKKNYI